MKKYRPAIEMLFPLLVGIALIFVIMPSGMRQMLRTSLISHPPQIPPLSALPLVLAGIGLVVWFYRRLDFLGRTLLVVGLAVFAIKVVIIFPIQYIGRADAAAYAEMAQSLIQGRGLEVDYISWYFRAYPPEILHPEEHWLPLYSFLIVPFFLSVGRTAFAAKLPALIISSLLLPLVGYDLGKRLTRSSGVGLAIGLHLLLFPDMFSNSLRCMSDVLTAFLVFVTLWLCIRGLKKPRMFLLMGISAALAFYSKGIAVLLIPAYALFYLIYRNVYRPDPVDTVSPSWLRKKQLAGIVSAGLLLTFLYNPTGAGPLFLPGLLLLYLLGSRYESWLKSPNPILTPQDRAFVSGIILCLIMLTPWLIRNTVLFKNPFYSTQKYVSGYLGNEPWEQGTYRLYWGKDLPRFTDKFKDPVRYLRRTGFRFKTNVWWSLVHSGKKWGEFHRKMKDTYITGSAAVITWIMLLLGFLYRLLRPPPASVPSVLGQWDDGRLHLTWMIPLAWISFLSIAWGLWNARLILPIAPMVILAGWFGYYQLSRMIWLALLQPLKNRLADIPRIARLVASVSLILLWLPMMHHQAGINFASWNDVKMYPFRERTPEKALVQAGLWIRDKLPGSVTMTRFPWEIHFYSQEPAVQIPLAPLREVIATAKYYGVTHIIPARERPALRPLVNGSIPGLKLVYKKGFSIYEILYDRLPPGLRDVPPIDRLRAD